MLETLVEKYTNEGRYEGHAGQSMDGCVVRGTGKAKATIVT
jgi:hypothetical protein